MDEKAQISNGLTTIFEHRSSFIVIGLTGRTGSGCSSVANLLGKPVFSDIEIPEPKNPPESHEDRKDRIVRDWLREHWGPFKKIQVSHIIQLLALQHSEKFQELIKTKSTGPVDIEKIGQIAKKHSLASKEALETLTSLRSAQNPSVIRAYDFIFDELPALSQAIKDEINKGENRSYTNIFQTLGDNIRKSGCPLSDEIVPDQLLALPSWIARVIKLARLRNKQVGEKNNYFVIDALRHPFEIRYLRERISPFYVMAITTNDKDRRLRLSQLDYTKTEITRLDEKEYPSEIKDNKRKPKGYAAVVSQNIQACLEISDIYIKNLGIPDPIDMRDASNQIVRYLALMQHPGLVTPTSIERCMHSAFSAKINSGCISRQVGAVITDENYSIKAIGWNDAPKGQVPCLLRNIYYAVTKGFDADAYSKYEKTDEFLKEVGKTNLGKLRRSTADGRNLTYCFKSIYNTGTGEKNQVHTRALHAEENAFLQIVKYGGQGIEGGCLFTTASPCELCAKKAYQLGIKHIFYIDPYPGISDTHILSVGKYPPEIHLFHGAIGRAYHSLYEPVMPFKDELERLIIS